MNRTSEHQAEFWSNYLFAAFCVLAAEATATFLYFLIAPSLAWRLALLLIAGSTAVASFAMLPLVSWVALQTWRADFAFGAALLTGAILTGCCALDGGIDSPLVYLFALPVVNAAVALSPRAVTICGLVSLAELASLFGTDVRITSSDGKLLVTLTFVAGTTVFAILTSRALSTLNSRERALRDELTYRASVDWLTGCLNQDSFYQRLDNEVDRAMRCGVMASLLMIDVDLFKSFNDARGHQAGDRALSEVGALLHANSRCSDVVGRVGGDEFAIILPATGPEMASEAAERILDECRRCTDLTLSIGVAALLADDPTAERWLRDADLALYDAKVAGRDRASVLTGSVSTTLDLSSSKSAGVPSVPEDREVLENRLRQVSREQAETTAFIDAIQRSAPVGLCLVDTHLRVLRINDLLAGTVGVEPDALVGKKLSEVVPYLWDRVGPAYEAVLSTGKAVTVPDLPGRPAPGSDQGHFWRSTNFPVLVEGKIIGIGSFVYDVSAEHNLKLSQDKLVKSMAGAVSSTVEMHDPYTAGHQRKVAEIAVAIARAQGLPEDDIRDIELAATVHDVGKVRVPSEILSRPGRLSDAEMYIVREHPETGAAVLAAANFPTEVSRMVLEHHERVDGSGYPFGLKGTEISQGAKIIAVADVVEAITSGRPYRNAVGLEMALSEVEQGRGTKYDPDVVDACARLFRDRALRVEPDLVWTSRVSQ